MKFIILALLVTPVSVFGQSRLPGLDIPPSSELPKYLNCGVYGSRLSDGRGSVLLAKGSSRLVYNQAKPKIDSKVVKSPWGNGKKGYRHFISWKLNSRKTAPATMEFKVSKIDVTNPKAKPSQEAKFRIMIQPSNISYLIQPNFLFESYEGWGFDLKADKSGRAMVAQYMIKDTESGKLGKFTSYGYKKAMNLDIGDQDYTYFGFFNALRSNDKAHRLLRDSSTHPGSYVKNLRFANSKGYLGKFSVVCTLRKLRR